MAAARKNDDLIEETVIRTSRSGGVTLLLTDDEARAVVDVFRRVGGSAVSTRRGLTQAVLDALYAVGVSGSAFQSPDLEGSVYFQNSSTVEPEVREQYANFAC